MTEVPRLTVANCHVYAYQHRKKSIFAYGTDLGYDFRQLLCVSNQVGV